MICNSTIRIQTFIHEFIHRFLHAAVPGYTLPSPLVPVPAEFSPQVPSVAVNGFPEQPSQAGDTGAHTVCPQPSLQPILCTTKVTDCQNLSCAFLTPQPAFLRGAAVSSGLSAMPESWNSEVCLLALPLAAVPPLSAAAAAGSLLVLSLGGC